MHKGCIGIFIFTCISKMLVWTNWYSLLVPSLSNHFGPPCFQDPSDKKVVVCDEKLKVLFAGRERVGFLEIAKLLNPHFVKWWGGARPLPGIELAYMVGWLLVAGLEGARALGFGSLSWLARLCRMLLLAFISSLQLVAWYAVSVCGVLLWFKFNHCP